MSALDLFASALGAFILVAVILFPYYKNLSKHKLPHTDVVIVLDTTGSMTNVTESLKTEIRDFAEVARRLAPSLAVGVVVFNDAAQIPAELEYFPLREIHSDTAAMKELEQKVGLIVAGDAEGENSGVGENLRGGLSLASRVNWRRLPESHLRVIAVVTDDVPHEGTEDSVFAAARDNICEHCLLLAIHALTERNDTAAVGSFLREMAKAGNGRYYETTSSLMTPILSGMLDHVN